jgi:hypothetical protein
MPLNWGSQRNDRRMKVARALIVCAAASALFLARSASPRFADPLSVHTVKADANHYQRPRFDNSTSRCCRVNTAFAVAPPNEAQARLTLASALLLSFPTKGLHYDRPPPSLSF